MERLPGSVDGESACGLQRRWAIDPTLARDIIRLNRWAADHFPAGRFRQSGLELGWPGIVIISGFRSEALVPSLDPTAPAALNSGHLQCPSLAVDLRVGAQAASNTPVEVWAWLGTKWKSMGHRWGGDFSRPDVNHFDLRRAVTTVSGKTPPTLPPVAVPPVHKISGPPPALKPKPFTSSSSSLMVSIAPNELKPTFSPVFLPSPIISAQPPKKKALGSSVTVMDPFTLTPAPLKPPPFRPPTIPSVRNITPLIADVEPLAPPPSVPRAPMVVPVGPGPRNMLPIADTRRGGDALDIEKESVGTTPPATARPRIPPVKQPAPFVARRASIVRRAPPRKESSDFL